MTPVPTKIPAKPVAFDTNAIDKTANPCDDFFQYACGNWNKNNPIPADRTGWGRFTELAEYNNYLLYKDLKAAADAPKTPLQKKYGDFFAACMNTDLIDKLGDKPLQPDLEAIDDAHQRQAARRLQRQAGPPRRWRLLRRRRHAGPEGLHPAGRRHRPGRPHASRPRLLPESRRRASPSCATATSKT